MDTFHIGQSRESNNTVNPKICTSFNNLELTGTCNSNIDHLSTRDTQSTVAVSEMLSIPLLPIASESDYANSIIDNSDNIV